VAILSASVCAAGVIETPYSEDKFKTMDAAEAVANVAYQGNEVIAICPITPSSAMGEWADEWFPQASPTFGGTLPQVIEIESEGGAAGFVHGALSIVPAEAGSTAEVPASIARRRESHPKSSPRVGESTLLRCSSPSSEKAASVCRLPLVPNG
jgi:Pyruvate flavodoxin/ferredoxin oxidoreductase, thiamine diP-bdg